MGTTTYAIEGGSKDPRGRPNPFDIDYPYVHADTTIFRLAQGTKGANTYAVTMPYRARVIDAWFRTDSSANDTGNTVTIKNAGTAITDALQAWQNNDKKLQHFTQIDDAQAVVEKGDALQAVYAQNSEDSNIGEAFVLVQILPTSEE